MKIPVKDKIPILYFKSQSDFRKWLSSNNSVQHGIWLQFFKKSSGIESISYSEALDEALCYGWIDGQLSKHDEKSWLHKFTPRRKNSLWSKRNIEHTDRLIKTKKMKTPGFKAIDDAKKNGKWHRAYDSARKMKVPKDFINLLSKNKKASNFFKKLTKTNKFVIGYRLQTAKDEETRTKRMKEIMEMMKKGIKFH